MKLDSKGIAVILLVLCLSISSFSMSVAMSPESDSCQDFTKSSVSRTLYVDDNNTNGPWNGTLEYPYQHINDALGNSSDGDMVFVFNGTYTEHVRIETSIQLIGEDKYLTIIDGGSSADENTIVCLAPGITISGFTIRGGGTWVGDAGIWIDGTWGHHTSDDNIITNNILSNNSNLAIQMYGSHGNLVTNNIIEHNGHGGIEGSGLGNVFSGNTMRNNLRLGGDFPYSTITNNTFEQASIILVGGRNALVQHNVLCNGSNLMLDEIADLVVRDNRFLRTKGIQIVSPTEWGGLIFINNTIDNKTIYVWAYKNDEMIPADAGQVIIANCQRVKIYNLTLMGTYGIQIVSSSSTEISSNKMFTTEGIQLLSSSSSIISHNLISTSYPAILLDHSPSNSISSNLIQDYGIICSSGSNNKFISNSITNCSTSAIEITGGTNTLISSNSFQNNEIGVDLIETQHNQIISNNFQQSKQTHATFRAAGIKECRNTWQNNYWDNHVHFGPKIIRGSFKTRFEFGPPGLYSYLYLPWFNIDRRPAHRPHLLELI